MGSDRLGLEGEFNESELPLLVRRAGMAEWHEGLVRHLDRRALPRAERRAGGGEEGRRLANGSAGSCAYRFANPTLMGCFSLTVC